MASVAIVGAGLLGSAVADELAAAGASVTVLESGQPGGGTSGASFAWNLITDELLMVRNKYRKVLGKTDLTDIVREFCPEELVQWAHPVA